MAKITLGLNLAAEQFGDMPVVCRDTPKKAVYALEFRKKGEMTIVPTTLKIKTNTSDANQQILMCTVPGIPDGVALTLVSMSGDIVCPAWYMRETNDAREANMGVTMFEVEVDACGGTSADTSKIAVPLFVNTKRVCVGTELVYCAPAKVEGVKATLKRPFDAM